MTWIRVETNVSENDKVRSFADDLSADIPRKGRGFSVDASVGLLIRLWGQVAEHRPDGDLSGITDHTIEDWALWRGKPGAFAKSFRRRFMQGDVLHGWSERQGKLAAQASAERARKRRGRSADTVTSSSSVVRDIGNQGDKKEKKNGVLGHSADIPRYLETLARLPETDRPALEGLVRAAQRPVPLVGEIAALLDGMHGPQASPEAVGQALRDLALIGTPVSGRMLRGFVAKAMTERQESKPGDGWDVAYEKALAEDRAAGRIPQLERPRAVG